MGNALETLCGQSNGAKQYHMLGVPLQRAMFVLSLVNIPIAFIWAYLDPILLVAKQDPDISVECHDPRDPHLFLYKLYIKFWVFIYKVI